MEIVSGVKIPILILGILGPGSANAFATAGHVVDHRIDVNLNALITAGFHHGFKLTLGSQLRFKLVAHRLVTNPPLFTLDVLLRRRDQYPVNARVTEVLALLSNGVEVPQKHLHANLILESVRIGIRGAAGKR